MNKLFNKIAVAVVGMAMAVGVGVALSNGRDAVPVRATGTNVDFAPSDFSGGTSGTGSSVTKTKSNITISTDKGYATTQFRVYKGGVLTIQTTSSYVITDIDFTTTSGYDGGLTDQSSISTQLWSFTTTAQARITAITVTYEAAEVEKGVEITGVSSSGLYLKGESYDIGYEVVGFDSDPTITDVSWTVTENGGSVSDGKWTAGSSAMKDVTLRVDLKADGDDYYAEVTTNIDEVSAFKKNSPKTSFTTAEAFTVGNTFIVEYTYAENGTVSEDDEGITYRLENSGGTLIKNITYNSTKFTTDDSGKYVDATYKGVDLYQRYSITVIEVFDYSAGAYYQVTSEPADWSGDYIIVNSAGRAFNGTDANSGYAAGTIDSTNKRIEYVSGMATLRLATGSSSGTYSVKIVGGNNNADKYLSGTSGSNTINFGNSASDCTITFNDSEDAVDIVSNTSKLWYNISYARFRFYKSSTTLGTAYEKPLIYKWVSNADKVQEFIDDNLMLTQYTTDFTYDKDRCDANYSAAKSAFNNLTSAQRALFVSEGGKGGTYEAAYNRLVAWAAANHETIGTDGDNANVLKAASVDIASISNFSTESSAALIIVITSLAGIIAIGGYFFIRKKKEN